MSIKDCFGSGDTGAAQAPPPPVFPTFTPADLDVTHDYVFGESILDPNKTYIKDITTGAEYYSPYKYTYTVLYGEAVRYIDKANGRILWGYSGTIKEKDMWSPTGFATISNSAGYGYTQTIVNDPATGQQMGVSVKYDGNIDVRDMAGNIVSSGIAPGFVSTWTVSAQGVVQDFGNGRIWITQKGSTHAVASEMWEITSLSPLVIGQKQSIGPHFSYVASANYSIPVLENDIWYDANSSVSSSPNSLVDQIIGHNINTVTTTAVSIPAGTAPIAPNTSYHVTHST